MWLVIQLFACGGGAELQKPHDPPAWPVTNILTQSDEGLSHGKKKPNPDGAPGAQKPEDAPAPEAAEPEADVDEAPTDEAPTDGAPAEPTEP